MSPPAERILFNVIQGSRCKSNWFFLIRQNHMEWTAPNPYGDVSQAKANTGRLRSATDVIE